MNRLSKHGDLSTQRRDLLFEDGEPVVERTHGRNIRPHTRPPPDSNSYGRITTFVQASFLSLNIW